MASSILDKYGIKEVADVVFYEMDSKGAPSAPVLYLDTLKVSTIEQSAEVVDATGGKGNVKLISWDTNKEVTATFEDALFSVKSLAIMFGGKVQNNGANQEVLKTVQYEQIETAGTDTQGQKFWKIPVGKYTLYLDKTKAAYYVYDGSDVKPVAAGADQIDFITFDILDAVTAVPPSGETGTKAMVDGLEITIDASTFGGTYYITGDTYARNYQNGQDEFLQFIIPKGKVSAEDLSLTMEADGDPATFSMNINVLRAADGAMFRLVKYTMQDATSGDVTKNKGVASVLTKYDKESVENAGWAASLSAIEKNPVEDSLPSSEVE